MLLSLPENPLVRPWGHSLPGAMSQLTTGEKMMEHFCCIFYVYLQHYREIKITVSLSGSTMFALWLGRLMYQSK